MLERSWLIQIQAGDERSFAQLYERYWQPLYAATYQYVRDRDVAEDLVQEFFANLWLKRAQMTIPDSTTAFLTTAMRYQVYDYLDKRAVQARAQQQLQYTISNSIAATDDAVAYHDLEEQLQTAVTKLPEPARTIFRLSRFEHWSNQAISEATNLAPKTIEYHLTRSLKRLRWELRELLLGFLVVMEGVARIH